MTQVYCIIFNESRDSIALVWSGGGWRLPRIEETGAVDPYDTVRLQGSAKRHLTLDLEPLYALQVQGSDPAAVLAVFEPREPVIASWFDPDSAQVKMADPFEWSLAGSSFPGKGTVPDTEFTPWVEEGFLQEAESWTVEQLSHRGIEAPCGMEHVKSSFLGKVLRLETSVGRVYFKAASHVYSREIHITEAVAAWRADVAPQLLAVERERRWMLTREVDGPTLNQVSSPEVWEEVLRSYARLQKESIEFLACNPGMPFYDWSAGTTAVGVGPMMEDLEVFGRDYGDPLSDCEIRDLRSLSPGLVDLCREVANSGIPDTLEHSDLHPGNIRVTENGPVFLDWAWSCMTHPFLTLSLLLHERKMPSDLLPHRNRLRRAYLEEWSDYGSLDQLETICRLVDRWRLVQYAVADADWLTAYLRELNGRSVQPNSCLGWALRQRRYYLIKTLRRLLVP